MATKQAKQAPRLQARHGWHGPEGVFEAGDLVEDVSAEREKELIDGGYVVALTARQSRQVAAAAAAASTAAAAAPAPAPAADSASAEADSLSQ